MVKEVGVSPIFSAWDNLLKLYDLSKMVALFSYETHFDYLWGISGVGVTHKTITEARNIWCVVDDCKSPRRWLHIGIWARYYRAKCIEAKQPPPQIIIVGRDQFLKPLKEGGGLLNIYVPDFYDDIGTCAIRSLISEEQFTEFKACIAIENTDLPSADEIAGLKALIYKTLTAEGSQHAVSNEIAPSILKQAIYDLFKIDIPSDGSDQEKIALLQLWNWATTFINTEESLAVTPVCAPPEKAAVSIDDLWLDDIWGVWSNARFLLIDDQAELNAYDQILKCALELMLGKEVMFDTVTPDKPTLKSKTRVNISGTGAIEDAEIDNIVDNYDCLFLDIRLYDADRKEKDYEKLTGIKIVKQIWEKDKAFPIIIFSSSQKREIENILSQYKNVITCFRKPGVAGSIESLDGNAAFIKILKATRRSLEMMECRKIYNEMGKLKDKEIKLPYINGRGRPDNIMIFIGKTKTKSGQAYRHDALIQMFVEIFLRERYDLAFTFPYAFFEDHFAKLNKGNDFGLIREFPPNSFVIKKNSYGEIKPGVNKLVKILNLHMKVFERLRNIAAHGIKNFAESRREAIAIFLLFVDTLLLDTGKLSLNPNELVDNKLSEEEDLNYLFTYTITNEDAFDNPLICYHENYNKDEGGYIYDLFSTICTYGNLKEYVQMYRLWKYQNGLR